MLVSGSLGHFRCQRVNVLDLCGNEDDKNLFYIYMKDFAVGFILKQG